MMGYCSWRVCGHPVLEFNVLVGLIDKIRASEYYESYES